MAIMNDSLPDSEPDADADFDNLDDGVNSKIDDVTPSMLLNKGGQGSASSSNFQWAQHGLSTPDYVFNLNKIGTVNDILVCADKNLIRIGVDYDQ